MIAHFSVEEQKQEEESMCNRSRSVDSLSSEDSPLVSKPSSVIGGYYDKVRNNASSFWRNGVLGIGLVVLAVIAVIRGRASAKFNGSYAPHNDFMPRLPGYDKPLAQDWYSGYLDYDLNDRTVHTHYVYVEAPRTIHQGEGPNDHTPLIYWTNGGPGASSLFGLLTEHGPLRLNDASMQTDSYKKTGVPTLLDNVHSWNNLGSFLVLDAPAPVGYSYCDEDLGGDGFSCGPWDDDLAAWNNYHALLAFFRKFPELKRRPLYLTGQSYGGIYVPMLAKRILDNRVPYDKHASSKHSIENSFPLKGIAIGNPCFGNQVNCGADPPFYTLFFLAGHGQVSLKLYDSVLETCGGEEALKSYTRNLSEECNDLLKQVEVQAARFFEYNLYDDCPENRHDDNDGRRRRLSLRGKDQKNVLFANGVNDYMCGGQTALDLYLSHPVVRNAMHIPDGNAWFDGDDGDGIDYKISAASMADIYLDIAKGKYADAGVKVLIYDGDTDPSISSMVAQDFVRNLGLKEVESWRPWTLDSCRRVGGSVTRYEGSIEFLTVRGSGHFVPQSKPEAALSFLKAWIHDEPFPEFDDSCFNE